MKNITLSITAIILMTTPRQTTAQTINWRSFTKNQNHVTNIHTGVNYTYTAAIGYGYKLDIKKLPVLVNAEFSAPFGKKPVDDFKAKLGGTVEVVNINNISVSVSVHGIYRRYQSELARLAGFGSEFAAAFGYYKTKWYVAGEVGFDKAIITHIKNSPIMKESYAANDGWYLPTGGNFSYGIRSGFSIRNNDLYVRIGKTISQDFKSSPIIPYYCMAGINLKMKS